VGGCWGGGGEAVQIMLQGVSETSGNMRLKADQPDPIVSAL
jgi:hypothetical protein